MIQIIVIQSVVATLRNLCVICLLLYCGCIVELMLSFETFTASFGTIAGASVLLTVTTSGIGMAFNGT